MHVLGNLGYGIMQAAMFLHLTVKNRKRLQMLLLHFCSAALIDKNGAIYEMGKNGFVKPKAVENTASC